MRRGKKLRMYMSVGALLLILGFLVFFLAGIFEGEIPDINLDPLPPYISGSLEFELSVSDMKRGLKTIKVSASQGGREIIVFEKRFPYILSKASGKGIVDSALGIEPVDAIGTGLTSNTKVVIDLTYMTWIADRG